MIIKEYNIMLPIKKKPIKKAGLIKMRGISGSVKKFDKTLFDRYDTDARQMIKNILGDLVEDNKNKYGEDMVFTKKDFPFKYLEIQVVSLWEYNFFPYTLPFVYARKMRFSDETLFITFNKFLNEILIFEKRGISNVPSRLKKYDREMVHYVPWYNTYRFKTANLSERLIREISGEIVEYSEENTTCEENTTSEIIET